MPRRELPDRLELPEGKEWFSLSDAAKALHVHKLTVYRWERKGCIRAPARIKRTNERRYSRAHVEEIWRWMTETVDPAA